MNTFIAVAVAVITNKDGKFLLTQRFSPKYPEVHLKWQLVGGKIEFAESPEDTVKRECLEEINCHVKIIQSNPILKTHIWHHTGREPQHTLVISYLCEFIEDKHKIVLDSETHSYKWFTLSELEKLDVLPQTTDIVEELLALNNKLH